MHFGCALWWWRYIISCWWIHIFNSPIFIRSPFTDKYRIFLPLKLFVKDGNQVEINPQQHRNHIISLLHVIYVNCHMCMNIQPMLICEAYAKDAWFMVYIPKPENQKRRELYSGLYGTYIDFHHALPMQIDIDDCLYCFTDQQWNACCSDFREKYDNCEQFLEFTCATWDWRDIQWIAK